MDFVVDGMQADMHKLNVLCDGFAQFYYWKDEKKETVFNSNQCSPKAKVYTQSLDEFMDAINTKLERSFQNIDLAFKFFNLSSDNQIREYQFWYQLSYFNLKFTKDDLSLIFAFLDQNKDGVIDR